MNKSSLYGETCRTCMKKGNGMKPIFSSEVNSVPVTEMLSLITPLIFLHNDGLPSTLCGDCLTLLISSYKFQQMCIEADEKFRACMSNVRLNGVINNNPETSQDQTQEVLEECNSISINENRREAMDLEINWKSPDVYDEDNLMVKFEFEELNEISSQDHERIDTDIKCDQSITEVNNTSYSLNSSNEKQIEIPTDILEHTNVNWQETHSDSILQTLTTSNSQTEEISFDGHPINLVITEMNNLKQNTNSDLIASHDMSEHYNSNDCLESRQEEIQTIEVGIEQKCSPYSQDFAAVMVPPELQIQANVNDPAITPTHECDQCKTFFDSSEELKLHHCQFPNEENGTICECLLCQSGLEPKPFPNHQNFTDYNLQKGKVQCKFCDILISSKNLVRHVKRLHTNQPNSNLVKLNQKGKEKLKSRLHKCSICKKSFQRKYHLVRHQQVHEKNKLKELEFTASGSEIGSNGKDKENRWDSEGEIIAEFFTVEDVNEISDSLIPSDDDESLPCKICGKKFNTSTQRREHMLEHSLKSDTANNSSIYECNTCSKAFATPMHLRMHMIQHNSFQCSKCGKEFNMLSLFEKHMRDKHSRSYVECPICKKKYSSAYCLKRHLRVVHQEVEEININNVQANSPRALIKSTSEPTTILNKRAYDKILLPSNSPHKCLECKVIVSCRPVLLRHMRRKHMDKFYKKDSKKYLAQCESCSKPFDNIESWINHVQQHRVEKMPVYKMNIQDTRKYECNICQGKLSTIWNVRRHLREIHGLGKDETRKKDVRLQCSECDVFLLDNKHFQIHIKRFHEHLISMKNGNLSSSRILKKVVYKCTLCKKLFLCRDKFRIHCKSHKKQQ